MKTFGNTRIIRLTGVGSRAIALLSIIAVLAGTVAVGVRAQQMEAAQKSAQKTRANSIVRLSEEQRILHVLNRLGFGARPGDMERVKAMGLENYINQQLNPTSVPDAIIEAKLRDKNLSTLAMTTAELYEKFPQPGQLLRQLQQRGALPGDLAAARGDVAKDRVKGGADAAPNAQDAKNSGEAMIPGAAPEAMPGETAKSAANNNPLVPANPQDNEKYREAIREYYQKNGLQPPQRITGELQASRILRAVYSERQLQEVMVDFWTNHFNVFAAKGADRWLLTAYDRDTIRPNSMGKFSDLLKATAESPAMLFYLDNFQSVSPNANFGNGGAGRRPLAGRAQPGRDPILELLRDGRRNVQQMGRVPNAGQQGPNMPQAQAQAKQPKRGINENYARELMELHTLGVDGGYTQKDVQEVARCFTGWTIFSPRG